MAVPGLRLYIRWADTTVCLYQKQKSPAGPLLANRLLTAAFIAQQAVNRLFSVVNPLNAAQSYLPKTSIKTSV